METPAPVTRVSAGFTRLSRLLAVVLAMGVAFGVLVPQSRSYLALVPGRTVPMVWNLLTCAFVETNVALAVVSVAAVLLMSRRIEPVYSTRTYANFVLVVALSSGVCTFATVYVVYYARRQGQVLFAEFYGFHGVLGGLLVALRHVMPGADLALFGALRIPTRYLPSLYMVAAGAWAYVKGPLFVLPPVLSGVLTAWVYLRFIQKSPAGLRGDPSEDFRLTTFFPAVLEPVLDPVFDCCGRLCCLSRAPPAEETDPLAPGTSAADAEANRRRQRGAKALEERLANKGSQLAASQPLNIPSQSAASEIQPAEP